jgi:DNA repair exonuclease SbcCD ATPase subunit
MKITLQTMNWSNIFSYGDNNTIDFSANPITQILGLNGHGKSSIALILEEVLYNKNSKGIKRSDIINRNTGKKSYSIDLTFTNGVNNYSIKTVRGTSTSVTLMRDGEDISSHTTTSTYKTIEELIGYDHKAFAQIVYQSSSNSLEFLTATDSNRKKFLIDLLDLTGYTEYGDVFKSEAKLVDTEIVSTTAKISSANDVIKKYKNTSLEPMMMAIVPNRPTALEDRSKVIAVELKNIVSINKDITANNNAKSSMQKYCAKVNRNIVKPVSSVEAITKTQTELSSIITQCDNFIKKTKKLATHCPTCSQAIDNSKNLSIVKDQQVLRDTTAAQLEAVDAELDIATAEYNAYTNQRMNNDYYDKYYEMYDPDLPDTLLDKATLESGKETLDLEIGYTLKAIEDAHLHNITSAAHNAKIEVIKENLKEARESLNTLEAELVVLNTRASTLAVLVKTFSNTGLVAYKIECLIKDLECSINHYLTELSSGRFQIYFKIVTGDKLNVVVADNGVDIEILALSGGERARINCATLFGIRKLLQSLSDSTINLLVLDETIESLDLDGKEKLIECLINETYLNTFIISHGFQHPLLEKIQVTKAGNISRIE